ncbi:hypothetical protein L484_017798 [Morus notabilis]|uniref:Uncharacterized protein n=1 Tax=Morus notabilis TaxID=981085 RepID=W9QQB5_9ROSA|nr:hypothetical protein L484_017798 [Morus notabilis]
MRGGNVIIFKWVQDDSNPQLEIGLGGGRGRGRGGGGGGGGGGGEVQNKQMNLLIRLVYNNEKFRP